MLTGKVRREREGLEFERADLLQNGTAIVLTIMLVAAGVAGGLLVFTPASFAEALFMGAALGLLSGVLAAAVRGATPGPT